MRLREVVENHFDPQAVYLHGGPAKLDGGALKRYGRSNSDMGALFFIKESPDGWRYALGYAVTKAENSGVYRVRINLETSQVFDFSRSDHRRIAQTNLSPVEYNYWMNAARSGHLDWAILDGEILEEWGFRGAVLFERPQGFVGYAEDVLSIGVFDAKDVQIIDFVPKQEALQSWGRTPALM